MIRRAATLFASVVVVVLGLSGCAKKELPLVTPDMPALMERAESNRLAAATEVENKRVEVTGTVEVIDVAESTQIVSQESFGYAGASYTDVYEQTTKNPRVSIRGEAGWLAYCFFEKKDDPDLLALSKGQSVTLRGAFMEFYKGSNGYAIVLEACKVAGPGTP